MTASQLVATEKELSQALVDAARLLGWLVYRTHDSRRSPAGFPDLVLLKPPRLVFAELKSETGRLRWEQQQWLASLRDLAAMVATAAGEAEVRGLIDAAASPDVEVYVWRPSNLDFALAILRGDGR